MSAARPWLILLLLGLSSGRANAEALPVFAPGGPDAASCGAAFGYPTAPPRALVERVVQGGREALTA